MLCFLETSGIDKLKKEPKSPICHVIDEGVADQPSLHVNGVDINDRDISTLAPGVMINDTIVHIFFE